MNRVPTMTGVIERRLLVNYRVDPEIIARQLPVPFRPQVVGGNSLAGICLIRLGGLRPVGLPAAVGMTTENAAHRIAVEWDEPHGLCRGVYIPRRDTSSRLTTLLGGRMFPGEHYRSRFCVSEVGEHYEVAFSSLDGPAHVMVSAKVVPDLPTGSVFASLADASAFFRDSPLGYSTTRRPGFFDGLELRCATWQVEPLLVEHAESSYFDDHDLFPAGSTELDSALLMRGISATWQAQGRLAWAKSHGNTDAPMRVRT